MLSNYWNCAAHPHVVKQQVSRAVSCCKDGLVQRPRHHSWLAHSRVGDAVEHPRRNFKNSNALHAMLAQGNGLRTTPKSATRCKRWQLCPFCTESVTAPPHGANSHANDRY